MVDKNTAKTDEKTREFIKQPRLDELGKLYKSTYEFHNRFDNYPPPSVNVLIPFVEEVGEVIDAFQAESNEELLDEIVDLFVTCFGLVMSRQLEYSHLLSAFKRVANKNDNKNTLTHVKSNGKIKHR